MVYWRAYRDVHDIEQVYVEGSSSFDDDTSLKSHSSYKITNREIHSLVSVRLCVLGLAARCFICKDISANFHYKEWYTRGCL